MQTIITDNIKAIQHICKQHHVKEMYFSFENSLKSLLNKNIDLVTKRFIENPYFLKAIQKNQQIIYVA